MRAKLHTPSGRPPGAIQHLPRGLAAAIASLLAFSLSGCTDYGAVTKLSGSMTTSVRSWKPVADDFEATCRRRNALEPSSAPPAADPCFGYTDTQHQLGDAMTILIAYFAALGAVADDGNFTVNAGITGLGASASKLVKATDPGHENRVTAIQGLASWLGKAATAAIRQRQMDQLIAHSGEAEQTIDAITIVLSRDYGHNVQDEARALRRVMIQPASSILLVPPQCTGHASEWKDPGPATATAGQLMFERYYNDACNQILAREAAIEAVQASASSVKASLRKLRSPETRLKDKAVIKALLKQADDLIEKAKDVEKAYDASGSAK